jgi:SpoVK/Ycf46/Vps4 family AAA+-type ATPase
MENFKEILDYIIKNESSKTVGILLKRIELAIEQAKKDNRGYLTFQEIEGLKAQIKEATYEAYRNLRDFLKTGKILFEFQSKEGKKGE